MSIRYSTKWILGGKVLWQSGRNSLLLRLQTIGITFALSLETGIHRHTLCFVLFTCLRASRWILCYISNNMKYYIQHHYFSSFSFALLCMFAAFLFCSLSGSVSSLVLFEEHTAHPWWDMLLANNALGIIFLVQKYIFIFYVALPEEITKCFGTGWSNKVLKDTI